MGVKDNKETFNQFLARFAIIITPLGLPDTQKISNLRRIITSRLRFNLTDGSTYSSYI